jgi:hypothetical protein
MALGWAATPGAKGGLPIDSFGGGSAPMGGRAPPLAIMIFYSSKIFWFSIFLLTLIITTRASTKRHYINLNYTIHINITEDPNYS